MLQEKVIKGLSGWLMVVVLTAGVIAGAALLGGSATVQESPWLIGAIVLGLALDVFCWFGLTVVNPNTARVVVLFGAYQGSLKEPGCR